VSDAEVIAAECVHAAIKFFLRYIEWDLTQFSIGAARALSSAPNNAKIRQRLRLSRQRLGEQLIKPRKGGVAQALEAVNSGTRWNRKGFDADDRSGIDPFEHEMRGGPEGRGAVVDGEVSRRPSWIVWWSRVKIVSAATQRAEHAGRYNDVACKCHQTCMSKQRRLESIDIGRSDGVMYLQLRTVTAQPGGQNRLFLRACQQDDGVEHGYGVGSAAPRQKNRGAVRIKHSAILRIAL